MALKTEFGHYCTILRKSRDEEELLEAIDRVTIIGIKRDDVEKALTSLFDCFFRIQKDSDLFTKNMLFSELEMTIKCLLSHYDLPEVALEKTFSLVESKEIEKALEGLEACKLLIETRASRQVAIRLSKIDIRGMNELIQWEIVTTLAHSCIYLGKIDEVERRACEIALTPNDIDKTVITSAMGIVGNDFTIEEFTGFLLDAKYSDKRLEALEYLTGRGMNSEFSQEIVDTLAENAFRFCRLDEKGEIDGRNSEESIRQNQRIIEQVRDIEAEERFMLEIFGGECFTIEKELRDKIIRRIILEHDGIVGYDRFREPELFQGISESIARIVYANGIRTLSQKTRDLLFKKSLSESTLERTIAIDILQKIKREKERPFSYDHVESMKTMEERQDHYMTWKPRQPRNPDSKTNRHHMQKN